MSAGSRGADPPPARSGSWAARPPTAVALTVIFAAAAVGIGVARHGEILELAPTFSIADLLAAAAGGLLGILLVVRPALALVATVVFVELHLSEVLVRFHGLPSLLRLLALPLATLVLLARPPAELAKIVRSPLLALLGAHAALAAASTFWAEAPEAALAAASRSLKALFVAVVAAVLVDSRARLRLALATAVSAGALLSALAVYQGLSGRFDLDFGGLARVKRAQIWGDFFSSRVSGPLGDPNFFAQALVALLPLAVAFGWTARTRVRRVASFAAGTLLFAAVVLTYSRAALVAALVVLAFSFVGHGLDRRRVAAAAAALLVVLLALPEDLGRRMTTLGEFLGDSASEELYPDSSFAKRRLLTRAAWEMFLDFPIAGVGAGNYTVRYDPYGDRVGSPAQDYDDPGEIHYPHSLYLETAAEGGVIGLALLGALAFAAFGVVARSDRALRRAGDSASATLARALGIGLAGYLLCAVFLHLRFERHLWLLLGVIAALPFIARRNLAASPEARAQANP
jgi:putative inorganic carbon (hco3(-)) transporter